MVRVRRHRRSYSLVLSLFLVATSVQWLAVPAAGLSPTVVISQVYGGGGNTGATYTHDFIELFNRGATDVSLAGWSVQYASATGTGHFGASSTMITELPAVTLEPGQYLLIQEAQGTAGTTPLPTPDVADASPIAMAAGAGKVALVNTTASLGCNGGSTPCSAAALATIVDLVGYGNANFFEGAGAAPTLTNTTAALRLQGGCTETDNNNADFFAGAPDPRNTASPLNTPCPTGPVVADCDGPLSTVEGTASSAPVSATDSDGTVIDLSITNVSPALSTGTITIADFSPAAGVGGTATANVVVDAAVSAGSYTVTVTATNDDATPETGSCALSVLVADLAAIHEIQGASHTSPLVGAAVVTTGVVTARSGNGFWVQDPNPDSDDATSEGLFVFTSSAPTVTVGDSVSVAGNVAEFRPGGSSTANLTTTELVAPVITVLSGGNALPAPTIIGTGGRVPPGEVIEDDATGSVETSGVFDPATDGIDFYESMEGMRVQLNDPVAVGPRSAFGEIPVVGDDGANAGVRTARGGIVIRPGDFNPERVHLDDVILPTPPVNVGDHFGGPAIGVLDYSFGNFKLQITEPLTGIDEGLAREVATPATDPDHLAIAAFNVENLDPGDAASKFQQLAELIVTNLGAPDLIALEEVQDNNGAVNDGVVDASLTLQALAGAIQAVGGPAYDFRQINPVDDDDGGEPGGNIRVAFLFRTDRGLAFVDRPGGTSTAATSIVAGPDGPELSFSPGRIDPTNAAFTDSRKPLAGEFTFNGQTLFVIANHFNSKGGDEPLFGRFQPPTLFSEVQRLAQAQIVNDFADAIVAVDPNAAIVALGDFNDFEFSAPLTTLKGTVLNDLIETLPQNERYSYVFEGNSQTLDHILVSDSLFAGSFLYDVVHVNSEFAVQASDHEPQVVRFALWDFEGFFPPVDNPPLVNTVTAGRTIPVEFSLSGDQGLAIFAAGYPTSFAYPCEAGAPADPIEETITPGNSALTYDPVTDTYTYPWKTLRSWANTCRTLVLGFADGSFQYADFQFRR